MTEHNDAQAYHLTPDGWVKGERPTNAVESWRRWAFKQAGSRQENIGWTSMWADPRIPRPDRNALRRQHHEQMGPPGRNGDVTTTIGDPI